MPMFNAPIPGQSLTREPKSRPFERPPEIVHPEQALQMHLKRMNDVEFLDAAMTILEMGLPVRMLASGVLRSAVIEGMHGVDVSLIIQPTIEKFLIDVAEATNTPFKRVDPDEDTRPMDMEREVINSFLSTNIRDAKTEVSEPEMDMEEPDLVEPRRGLMAREEI